MTTLRFDRRTPQERIQALEAIIADFEAKAILYERKRNHCRKGSRIRAQWAARAWGCRMSVTEARAMLAALRGVS